MRGPIPKCSAPRLFRCCWQAPVDVPPLAPDCVHLWRLRLSPTAGRLERLAQHLSPGERERAARFRLPQAGRRYVAARGMLRELLGRYLERKPGEIELVYGPHGKPRPAGEGLPDVRFNMADSGNLALAAFTLGRECGVDLERIRPDLPILQVAARFFSQAEVQMLRALPARTRRQAFFCSWTAKEAFLKATGEGIFGGLHRPGGWPPCPQPGPIPLAGGERNADHWHLLSLAPAPGYAGALVVAGGGWQVLCLQGAC